MAGTAPLRVVPREDVWVICPRCGQAARILHGVASCSSCAWVHSDAGAGHWCECCHQWEGDCAAPAAGRYDAQVTTRCPVCGVREIRTANLRAGQHPAARRCTCGAAMQTVEVTPVIDVADGVDALYGLPFWLNTACSGHQLWAANREHVDYLRGFLGTPNRPNGHAPTDRQLGHRLPAWLLSAKHRPTVLRALDGLALAADRLPS